MTFNPRIEFMKILVLFLLVISNAFSASVCSFQKIEIPLKKSPGLVEIKLGAYFLNIDVFEITSNGFSEYGSIRVKGGLPKCDLIADNVNKDSFAYSSSKQKLLIMGLDGSTYAGRVFDLKTCKEVGRAVYSGKANLKENLLITDASCEPLRENGTLGACSNSKIFKFDEETCAPDYLKEESLKHTKTLLGVAIPENSMVEVEFPRTKKARIVKKIEF